MTIESSSIVTQIAEKSVLGKRLDLDSVAVEPIAKRLRELPTVNKNVEPTTPEFGAEFKRLKPLYEAMWDRMLKRANRG